MMHYFVTIPEAEIGIIAGPTDEVLAGVGERHSSIDGTTTARA